MHYAASLSFHTILALIPILLLSFFLFTKLPIFSEYVHIAKEYIFSSILPIHHDNLSQHINQFMTNTNSLGVIGVVFVLYVSIMFFDDFEYVVNKIYKKEPRRLFHSLSIYLIITILMPIGLGVSLFLSIKSTIIMKNEYIDTATFLSINSYIISWLLFFILYTIAANTKVYFKSAFIASFIASLVWFSSKTLFVYYVAINKTYATIYGSFSTIMFFLLWIYFSWIIFLYGVKLCYTINKKITSGLY